MESGDGGADEHHHEAEESRHAAREQTEAADRCDVHEVMSSEGAEETVAGDKSLEEKLSVVNNSNGDSRVENTVDGVSTLQTKDCVVEDSVDVCRVGVCDGNKLQACDDNHGENILKMTEHEIVSTDAADATDVIGSIQPNIASHTQAHLEQTGESENDSRPLEPDTDYNTSSIEKQPDEEGDGGDIKSGVTQENDADGTVEESEREGDQAQRMARSQAYEVDEDYLQAMFDSKSATPSTYWQSETEDNGLPLGHFPALDNVDFQSDEEGENEHVDDASHRKDELKQDIVANDEETGHRLDIKGASGRFAENDQENVSVKSVGGQHVDSAAYSTDNDTTKSPLKSLHADYPLNYQNYKVCRELRPGIKECLILETGEQFICVGSTSPHDVPESMKFPVDGLSEPQDVPESVKFSDDGSPVPHDVPESVKFSDDGSPGPHGDGVKSNSDESRTPTAAEILQFDPQQGDRSQNSQDTISIVAGDNQANTSENWGTQQFNAKDNRNSQQANFSTDLDIQPSNSTDNIEQQHESFTDNQVSLVLDSTEYDLQPETQVKNQVDTSTVEGKAAEGEAYRALCEKQPLMKKERPREERFVELQPDTTDSEDKADTSEDPSMTPQSCDNVNNSSNQRGREEDTNLNENANYQRSTEDDSKIRTSFYPSARSHRSESAGYASSYGHSITSSRGQDMSRSSKDHTSKNDSWCDRSREHSTVDSSRLSTRYTHIERGDPRTIASRTESVTMPKFKTLQDQQVSWLEMFKIIEQQHRTELQSQYLEHQKILQEMQKNMEKELIKQQDTLKQRLCTHRDMLEELSPVRQNLNQSRTHYDRDHDNVSCQRSFDNVLSNCTSHTTLQGMPVSLRNPPPISRYHRTTPDYKLSDELPVKRSLEKEMSSPSRPADTSLSLSSRVSIDRDKQLRGGVYSSPMPLAKVKHKHWPQDSKSYDSVGQGEMSHNTSSNHMGNDITEHHPGCVDVSLTESDDVLSPRTRSNLREKHAKHIADLRAYYEKELQEMQKLLSSREGVEARGGGDGVTAGEKILVSENQDLRQKCQNVQEAYHDAKVEIRELQQKIQGLDIRAADYAERYSSAQSQVLTLKSRLEELTDYARERESIAVDLETKNRKNMESVQLAHKKEKELAESLHSAKNTIQKLVDKYEVLEKDHDILKESLSETQEKLYSSRGELMDANNKLSRLELENKHLKHDIESLKHELSMARSSLPVQTSYEEAYHKTGSQDRGKTSFNTSHTSNVRSRNRSQERTVREQQIVRSESSPESETGSDYIQSPIMKAERELKKLHQSHNFSPKLQHKFYGTEIPSHHSGPALTIDRSNKHSASSPGSTRNVHANKARDVASSYSAPTPHFSSSPEGGSKFIREKEKMSGGRNYKDKTFHRNRAGLSKKSSTVANGLTSDQAIERVRSGDVLARPAWEDVYTSLVSDHHGNTGYKGTSSNHTRDQLMRERIQNIENLERKYDDLTNEKRKLEAALSKLPVQGHGRERDRLETELDRMDRELGSVRMSLKRYHVLKSTI